jgi:hypothetical protein
MDAQGLAAASLQRNGHDILLPRFEPAGPALGHGRAVERLAVRGEPVQLSRREREEDLNRPDRAGVHRPGSPPHICGDLMHQNWRKDPSGRSRSVARQRPGPTATGCLAERAPRDEGERDTRTAGLHHLARLDGSTVAISEDLDAHFNAPGGQTRVRSLCRDGIVKRRQDHQQRDRRRLHFPSDFRSS